MRSFLSHLAVAPYLLKLCQGDVLAEPGAITTMVTVVKVASVSPTQDSEDLLGTGADLPTATHEESSVTTDMHLSPRSIYPGSWPESVVSWYSWMPEDARSEILAAAGLPVSMILWKAVDQSTQALGDDGKYHTGDVNARPIHKIAHVKGSWPSTGGTVVPISTKFFKHEYTTLREYIEGQVAKTMSTPVKTITVLATASRGQDKPE